MTTAPKAQPKGTDLHALFSNLTIEVSEEPLPEPVRARDSLPNPFGPPLLASIEHGTPYTIHVPADAVQRSVFLINAAARKENVGVRVVVNVQRDEKGRVVKGTDGKAVPIVDTKGPHKGTVLVRFQGKAERKQQTAPRTHTIITDPDNTEQKAIRRRADKVIVARGTHDEMKARLKEIKAAEKEAATQQPAA